MIHVATASTPAGIDWDEWLAPLQQFSQASGLVVSAWAIGGVRRVGPLLPSASARLLGASTMWQHDEAITGAGAAVELAIVEAVAAGEDHVETLFHGMRVCSLPLTRAGRRYGVLVFGWGQRGFSSPMACEQLAALTGASGQALWREVRLEAPLTDARMATYRELLRTLAGSLDRQRDTIDELHRVSRTRDLFLATVSHEMRTPLSALSMRVELLLKTLRDMPPALETALLAMRVHVRQEAAMVEDLIDAARTLTGTLSIERAPVSLGRIVRDAVSAIETSAHEKQIAFSVSPSDFGDSIQIEADPRRLQQVLWNLILNAIKFTPVGGAVKVAISVGSRGVWSHGPDPTLDQSPASVRPADATAAFGTGVRICVSDSGQGIAREDLPHVFGAFTLQTEANASGLGLGLYIARSIVELHGGSLAVASDGIDQGTSFTVELPLARDAGEAIA